MNRKVKAFIIILIVIILLCAGAIAYKTFKDKNENTAEVDTNVTNEENDVLEVELKSVQTFKGDDRPIAVMIDNHKAALPQGGLNNAYIVYEIIVEGGESRLMALFKGQNLEKIGPVRSARHYFLDYALENDAIYVHYGWSPQAQSDISSLGVNNINGIFESESSFWRVKDKSAPHNVATSTEKILSIAKRKGYKTTSSTESVLNYVTNEVNLKEGQSAEIVTIPYSDSNIVKYTYNIQLDEDSLNYERFVTYLRFFFKRLNNKNVLEEEDDFLLEQVKDKYKKAYECMLKVEKYLGQKLSQSEKLYLTLHIQRVTAR